MRTIHKFMIPSTTKVGEAVLLPLARTDRVLCAQNQGGHVVIWVEVDRVSAAQMAYDMSMPSQGPVRTFVVLGTGWEVPSASYRYFSTVQIGPMVWHVYEVM